MLTTGIALAVLSGLFNGLFIASVKLESRCEGGEYLARGDGCFLPRNADHHVLLQLIRVVENSGSGSPICCHERSSVWIAWGFCAICFGKSVDNPCPEE